MWKHKQLQDPSKAGTWPFQSQLALHEIVLLRLAYGNEDILGFEISMNELVVVNMTEAIENLAQDVS